MCCQTTAGRFRRARVTLLLCPVLSLLMVTVASSFQSTPLIIGFDGLSDGIKITNQLTAQFGLTFVDTTVINTTSLSSHISLNEFEFPPHSGTNVATDNGGPMTIRFAVPVGAVGGYFTYGQ